MNGELWDMDRPLEQDCSLHFLRFDDEDAQTVSLPPLDASLCDPIKDFLTSSC